MQQPDLFAVLMPPCHECQNWGKPIDSGVAYCHGELTWRGPDERVEGCVYRERAIPRWKPADLSRADNLRDLLTSPRHSISSKGRAWLRAELRREEAA